MPDELDGQNELFSPRRRTRTGDPETSLEAAESVTQIGRKQGAVLKLLELIGPATDVTINVAYRRAEIRNPEIYPQQSDSGLRARRSELVTLGLVHWTGRRELLPSKRHARIWGVL